MAKRPFQSRLLRRFHKGQEQVEGLGSQAETQISENLVKRFGRLAPIRRFLIGWLGLVMLLIFALVIQNLALSGYYQSLKPVPGGIYNEGVKGRFTNANPLYATSDADSTVSRLIFAGLLIPNDKGRLTGDLARSYSVSDNGTTYTVHLRPGLTWHDGHELTSKDVLFTYKTIQNPDTQSPLQSSLQGVEISAPDKLTVVFKLPDALAAFPYNLTNGIVPEHLLGKIPPGDLRSADFNTVRPVGAGPFAWQAIEVKGDGNPKNGQEQIALTPFADYHAGKPKLQKFVVQVFASQEQLIEAFESKQLTGVAGLNEVPSKVKEDNEVVQHNLILRAATMVFFKTSAGVLSDQKVRQALVQGADVSQIMRHLGYPTREVREPLLVGQLAYDPALKQAGFDLKAAQKILADNGWLPGPDGTRMKDSKPLTFTLVAAKTPENRMVTRYLQQQWKALGVKLNVQLQDNSDFQSTLNYHSYDAILNGISIGVDPDVFVYWDSSQADARSSHRLNLSEYKNATADAALESGRTRIDPGLRIVKYKPFLQEWQKDAPALGLYQPRLLYLTNGPVDGLSDKPITSPTDRFINVQNWQIREAKVTN
ncbi:MAG TPA: ABC transporter substrate-binding protein [Candidatus Saccharimonadales bacterium]|nr:ABC transporter substrate-binding protein [Candidatus Saccharimonadales bacterium]